MRIDCLGLLGGELMPAETNPIVQLRECPYAGKRVTGAGDAVSKFEGCIHLFFCNALVHQHMEHFLVKLDVDTGVARRDVPAVKHLERTPPPDADCASESKRQEDRDCADRDEEAQEEVFGNLPPELGEGKPN
jgi:hypothetical protein